MRQLLLVSFIIGVPLVLFAQREPLKISGMELSYTLRADSIDLILSAPTTGWVGIGFNDQNSILHSDLLLFRVHEGQVEGVDMYVVGMGNPQEDSRLGGQHSATLKGGTEAGDRTTIRFSLALDSQDVYDFTHQVGRDCWLIMAYSTHDDFGHHSRIRKHLIYRFE